MRMTQRQIRLYLYNNSLTRYLSINKILKNIILEISIDREWGGYQKLICAIL